MHVRLKGINRVTKTLAGGKRVTYYYAWKGGPRLPGAPGDQEFIAAFNDAIRQRSSQPDGTIQSIVNQYQASPVFADLAPRTRRDYAAHICLIEAEFGDFPLDGLTDRRTRAEFLGWRDRMAIKSRRQADYVFATFARILAWAFDRGLTLANPCEKPGRLYRSARAESIWTEADEAAASTRSRCRPLESRLLVTNGSFGLASISR